MCRSHVTNGESAFFISLSMGPRTHNASTNHQLLQQLILISTILLQSPGPGLSRAVVFHAGRAGALCFTGASLGVGHEDRVLPTSLISASCPLAGGRTFSPCCSLASGAV